MKRVSDLNAMGQPTTMPAPAPAPTPQQYAQNPYGAAEAAPYMAAPVPATVNFGAPTQANYAYDVPGGAPVAYDAFAQPQQAPYPHQPNHAPYNPQVTASGAPNPVGGAAGQFGMFQQPIVQDMAMQYGQQLADQGKQLVETQFEKYVPVTRLKYYFAVDNQYVINKLKLIFFPFAHKEWALKYDPDNPVQPRFDINALDLYIPTMAYITYVVLAGFVLGRLSQEWPRCLI